MKIKRILIATFCGLLFILHAKGQTLFTYGTHAVDKNEFLKAYNKNPDTTGDRAEKMRQYLDLYINFRLKLQAAYDEGVDSNEQIKTEADNFKDQLTENFINDQSDLRELVHEAFLRNKKDILVQQVFVAAGTDTAAAYAQISKAYNELKAGKNFDSVTKKYSSDSAVRASGGTIGYVTVFTLPYSIENIIYSLKPGGFSTIYKSKAGYHIFRDAAERPALGRRKVQQLLFPVLPFFNDEQKAASKAEADSVYNVLQKGGAFTPLLAEYGHSSEGQEGNTVEIKVGEYNGNFEKEVFGLAKPGDLTRPFKTEYGYNIVKLVEIIPPITDESDVESAAYLQEQIKKDGRLDVAKQKMIPRWLALTHFKAQPYNQADLWAYSDSALKMDEDTMPALYKGIKPSTTLFEFEKKKTTVSEWIAYLRFMQGTTQATPQGRYEKMMRDFTNGSCEGYYKEHIEDFAPSIKEQLKEFNDANMLFFVMDKHVWSKAPEDTAGLNQYYKEHADQYKWNKSLSAVVISGPDKSVITEIAARVKEHPADWRNIITPYGSTIYADSSRFEADQLPVKQSLKFEKDFQTDPEANDAGDAFTFVHVMQIFPQPEPRSFEEARGLVINDYQQQLEQQWVDELKKKYPVKVNDAVLKTIR